MICVCCDWPVVINLKKHSKLTAKLNGSWQYFSLVFKALLHEENFAATCNAIDEESIARQVAGCMLHNATYLTTLRKVET